MLVGTVPTRPPGIRAQLSTETGNYHQFPTHREHSALRFHASTMMPMSANLSSKKKNALLNNKLAPF
jgi:hypothetical protein